MTSSCHWFAPKRYTKRKSKEATETFGMNDKSDRAERAKPEAQKPMPLLQDGALSAVSAGRVPHHALECGAEGAFRLVAQRQGNLAE